MEGRAKRRLVVTVRGAADLNSTVGAPYVSLTLGDQTVATDAANGGGANLVWDEPIELRLPPARPNEPALQIKARVMSRIRLCPDAFVASGTTTLDDLLYGGGQHEVSVPLTDKAGREAGHLHLGLLLEKVAAPGEVVGSAAGTVLGEVHGGAGAASPRAAAVPGPVLPSADTGEMQVRDILGAGGVVDPSKPGFGLLG